MARKRNAWLDDVHAAWRAANDAWEAEAEQVALGYATELAEFAYNNPRPRLKDFLVHMSHGTDPSLGGTA